MGWIIKMIQYFNKISILILFYEVVFKKQIDVSNKLLDFVNSIQTWKSKKAQV